MIYLRTSHINILTAASLYTSYIFSTLHMRLAYWYCVIRRTDVSLRMAIYRWNMQRNCACRWLALLLCAYVDGHTYVHMGVCTFMCICWLAHICAYGGVHIHVYMFMGTYMCIWWCAHKQQAQRSVCFIFKSSITQPPGTSYKLCCAVHISRAWLQSSIPKLFYLQRRPVIPRESWRSHEKVHFQPINFYRLLILFGAVRVIKSRRMRWAGHVAHMGREVCSGSWWGHLK